MLLPPEKRGIWLQRVRNRLAEKKDVQKVDGSLYIQQNAVFDHDFHHILAILSWNCSAARDDGRTPVLDHAALVAALVDRARDARETHGCG